MCEKLELYLEPQLTEIAGAVAAQLTHGQIVDFVMEIDAEAQDWSFTAELAEHLTWKLKEMKAYSPEEYKRIKKRLVTILKGGDPDELLQ